jgi:hypothetical protein
VTASSHTSTPPTRCVPRQNREFLADPRLADAPGLADAAHRTFAQSQAIFGGRSLHSLRQWTAEDTFVAANRYAAEFGRRMPTSPGDGPIIVGGHQPTLFHCGVLLKNFAISRLARHVGGAALNLIVDNDLATSGQLKLPAADPANPAFSHVSFTDQPLARPWEDLDCGPDTEFHTFADRVHTAMSAWDIDPVLPEIWPAAMTAARRGAGMSDCLSAPRMALQDDLGASTFELPISRLASREPFQWYVAFLLGDAERFAVEHNQALAVYRRVHRVRSRTHPAPDLTRDGDWVETPFWCWHAGETRRRRLLTNSTAEGILLSDGTRHLQTLPRTTSDDPKSAADLLAELQRGGLRIRPSALSTTLFARVFLADLFVHGIGGSKYDEVTDMLMERFFEIAPPTFLTLSGTLHLPLAEPYDVAIDDLTQLESRLRRIRYNSQEFLPAGCGSDLQDQKRRLIADQQNDQRLPTPQSRQRRKARYQEFRSVNQALRKHTDDSWRAHEQTHHEIRRQLDANAVLANREFSFCLFPKELLKSFFELSLTGLT